MYIYVNSLTIQTISTLSSGTKMPIYESTNSSIDVDQKIDSLITKSINNTTNMSRIVFLYFYIIGVKMECDKMAKNIFQIIT